MRISLSNNSEILSDSNLEFKETNTHFAKSIKKFYSVEDSTELEIDNIFYLKRFGVFAVQVQEDEKVKLKMVSMKETRKLGEKVFEHLFEIELKVAAKLFVCE